jgi:TldD protein
MASVMDAEQDLANAVARLGRHSPYAEVMAERETGRRLRVDRQETKLGSDPRLSGAVFRAWAGDLWVEAATSGLDAASLERTVTSLEATVKRRTRARAPPGEASTAVADRATHAPHPFSAVPSEEAIDIARGIFDQAKAVDGVHDAYVTLLDNSDERLFLSTAGAKVHQTFERARVILVVLAMENGKVEYDFAIEGGEGGREVIDRLTNEQIVSAATEAKKLLSAGAPPTGPMSVILDPTVSGTFAHESFGHGTEADQFVRDRSYLKPILGETVGPETVSIVDDGSIPGGWGSFFYDDEGHPSQRTVLVDHGRFVGILTDRDSAAVLHRTPTGNTRRSDFESRAYVRMSNTFVEPGDWSLEELVEEAKDGVLLQNCTNGIEDPLGGQMQFKTRKARLIEHGTLGAIVPGLALSGKVLDFLRDIRGVGSEMPPQGDTGFCGKGHTDLLPVGSNGPYLLSHAAVGPA